MFYHLLYPLVDVHTVFNVFRYITFRTIAAVLTSMLVCLIFGPKFIRFLHEQGVGETIRQDGPCWHSKKAGTPTMGGVLILVAALTATLLWANLANTFVWLVLGSVLCFGAIGLWDDIKALRSPKKKGLSGRFRLALEFLIAASMACVLVFGMDFPTMLSVPFFKDIHPELGIFYIPFATLVIVGTANAVNLTDGLDGLATGPVIIASGTYLLFTYITGNIKIAQYLQLPFVPGVGELTVLCGAIVGAGMGFLWYNTYPAEVFMGDVGSLSLGAALGSVAVVTKHEILLAIVGGIFVIEALSVIFQVTAFKVKGRRIFRMAPIHHHFEMKGWEEPKIIVRFWILSIFLALLALSTLKLR